jgi:GTP-binding protein LepA
LRALIFDSYYDSYKGVIAHVRVKEGQVRTGEPIKMMYTNKSFDVTEVGYFRPGGFLPCDVLKAGDVGYITASIKTVGDTRVGDTITSLKNPAKEPLRDIERLTL